jgi:hypothetical protein
MSAPGSVGDVPRRNNADRPLRIAVFANFFKSYMSVSTIVAASIPIPVASLKLIPSYAQQRGYLTVYASLFCFLCLAFVFSIRHRLAARIFSGGKSGTLIAIAPAACIALTLASILSYHFVLQHSLSQLRSLGVTGPTSEILNGADYSDIPDSLALSACYLGIFLFSEMAFVLMAMREYLQDLLNLDEATLMKTTQKRHIA